MKKGLIIYSSRTGNTKKVAEAMQAAQPDFFDIAAVEEKPAIDGYELIVFGYWVNRSAPNASCVEMMKSIKNKKVALFQTLGAEAMGAHAMVCMANAGTYLGEGCKVIGAFSCQGGIAPEALEAMKRMPANGPHKMSPENIARWSSATGHPDEEDVRQAQDFIAHTVMMFERFYK